MSVEHLSSQSHKGKTKILNSILFGSCWFCFTDMRQQEKTGKEMCIGLKLLTYFWNSHSVSHYLSLLSILQDKLAKLAAISDERISKLHTQALYIFCPSKDSKDFGLFYNTKSFNFTLQTILHRIIE